MKELQPLTDPFLALREITSGSPRAYQVGYPTRVAASAALAEIERLRGWLRYIACNFRDGEECASEALDGKPIPEGFEG